MTADVEAESESRLEAKRLTDFGVRVLIAHGVPTDDARLVSESLVTADLWGHPSHGMLRLPWYAARLRSGVMTAVTQPKTISSFAAVTVLDACDGIGQVVPMRAVDQAACAAAQFGVGVVAVRNSNHFGTAAFWTRILAERGCVAILTTNGSPAMAPWGGRQKMIGANPWSIAVPGGRHGTVVLDIANTGVARGKIYAAAERGARLPDGWAIDAAGLPTNDPQAAIDGLILPMAGHKGYAISFMMDVLSGVLTGSGSATEIVGPYVPDQRSGCGHLVMAIDIEAVTPRAEFDERMDRLITAVKSCPAAPGADILVPGELENRAVASAGGVVVLPARTVAGLNTLAAESGVAHLTPTKE